MLRLFIKEGIFNKRLLAYEILLSLFTSVLNSCHNRQGFHRSVHLDDKQAKQRLEGSLTFVSKYYGLLKSCTLSYINFDLMTLNTFMRKTH